MARYVFNLDLIQGVRILEQNTNQQINLCWSHFSCFDSMWLHRWHAASNYCIYTDNQKEPRQVI